MPLTGSARSECYVDSSLLIQGPLERLNVGPLQTNRDVKYPGECTVGLIIGRFYTITRLDCKSTHDTMECASLM